MKFAIVQNGKAMNPSSTDEVLEMIRHGEITKNAKIWRPPWETWSTASEVFPQAFGLSGDLFEEMEKHGEFPHQPVEDIYARVFRVVPIPHLEELLRKSKETPGVPGADVRIGSKNKEELVQMNIRGAVHSGALNQAALETLVQEYEESGKQRIFIRTLRSATSASDLDFTAVGKRLFGKGFEQMAFPKFHWLPKEPEISSFRPYKSTDLAVKGLGFTSKYSEGWILRIDASLQVDESITSSEPESTIRSKILAPKLVDAVCVVRYWSELRLLEIRIPNFTRRPSVLALRDAVIEKFGGQIRYPAFEDLTLHPACTRILKALLDRGRSELGVRRVAGSFLREEDGSTMRIELQNTEAGDILSTSARLVSLKEYLNNSSQVESLICWIAPPGRSEEVRVVIAPDNIDNEISIRKKTSAVALDYVIHRLHQNS
jgi:hypothetical protein